MKRNVNGKGLQPVALLMQSSQVTAARLQEMGTMRNDNGKFLQSVALLRKSSQVTAPRRKETWMNKRNENGKCFQLVALLRKSSQVTGARLQEMGMERNEKWKTFQTSSMAEEEQSGDGATSE